MMARQEGYGCSSSKPGSFVGAAKGIITTVSHHSQYGESVAENMSPRSVLEHRALSGLAIAIILDSHPTTHHVVSGRYCGKQKIVTQKADSHHSLTLGSFCRERFTPIIHRERETASDAPIVGLRMVASLYPFLHMGNSEAKKRHESSIMGRSVSRESMLLETMRYDEQQKQYHVLTSANEERKQADVCGSKIMVSMSNSPPLEKAKSRHSNTQQPTCCKWNESSKYGLGGKGFLGGTSTEESIFYYNNNNNNSNNHFSSVSSGSAIDGELSSSTTDNFLKVCALCESLLGVGKDIYMYRGDQAFCSAECRYQQIMIDDCMDA